MANLRRRKGTCPCKMLTAGGGKSVQPDNPNRKSKQTANHVSGQCVTARFGQAMQRADRAGMKPLHLSKSRKRAKSGSDRTNATACTYRQERDVEVTRAQKLSASGTVFSESEVRPSVWSDLVLACGARPAPVASELRTNKRHARVEPERIAWPSGRSIWRRLLPGRLLAQAGVVFAGCALALLRCHPQPFHRRYP